MGHPGRLFLATPRAWWKKLDAEFHFTLDPAASDEFHMTKKYYTVEDNALVQDWSGEVVWVSPPWKYDEMMEWLVKCAREARVNNVTIVGIYPVQEWEWWWDEFAKTADEIRYIEGGLKFVPMWDTSDYPYEDVGVQPHCLLVWHGKEDGRRTPGKESTYPNG